MRVLVLGYNGQIGSCLNDQLKNTSHNAIYASRNEIDISDFNLTKSKISKINPHVVINASAYTAVDNAEENEETANIINGLAVRNIAKTCNDLDSLLVHISTDYVFDGLATTPYQEDHERNPQSIYGKSKLYGELAIEESGCKYLIIRTAWVFSEYGKNFLKTILKLGLKEDNLKIVSDQIGCPTYAQDIAKAIIIAIEKIDKDQKGFGIYHYCGDTPCSWHEFAGEIFKHTKNFDLKSPQSIIEVKTDYYPTLAKRPPYSVLSSSKFTNYFNYPASDWKKGIIEVLRKFPKEYP